MDLVNRLKYYLEENKIAISQFADKCRIPRPTLSQILNGRNKKISDELISKIHEAYPRLSVLWLMFGEGDMEIRENTRTSEHENAFQSAETTSQHADNKAIADSIPSTGGDMPESMEKSFSQQAALPWTGRTDISATDTGAPPSHRPTFPPDPSSSAFRHRNHTEAAELDFAAEYEDPAPYGIAPIGIDAGSDISRANADSRGYASQPGYPALEGTHMTDDAEPPVGKGSDDESQTKRLKDPDQIVFMNANAPGCPQEEGRTRTHDGATADTAQNTSGQGGNNGNGVLSVPTLAGKSITNIVVFYSDNSFQSFSPARG